MYAIVMYFSPVILIKCKEWIFLTRFMRRTAAICGWLIMIDYVDIFMLLSMPCKPGKHISTCIIHVNVFDIHMYVCV